MKIKTAPKYQLGQTFSREGKCSLRVYGFVHSGEYVLCKVLRAISGSNLAEHFHSSEIVQGATLIIPGNRKRVLISERDTGYWDWTDPEDLIVLKETELEELCAEEMVRFLSRQVARMDHPERQSRANRYAPKNAR
jgi:hypothetical protein